MYMSLARIKQLREALEEENIDMSELIEIDSAFKELVASGAPLRDLPENALAADQLDELEEVVPPLERSLFEYIDENYGESEALDPCYNMGELVQFVLSNYNVSEK